MDLRSVEYRDPMVVNGIDNNIGINGRSEAGEVHQISQGVLYDKIEVRGK
jgi:hypothetical protein